VTTCGWAQRHYVILGRQAAYQQEVENPSVTPSIQRAIDFPGRSGCRSRNGRGCWGLVGVDWRGSRTPTSKFADSNNNMILSPAAAKVPWNSGRRSTVPEHVFTGDCPASHLSMRAGAAATGRPQTRPTVPRRRARSVLDQDLDLGVGSAQGFAASRSRIVERTRNTLGSSIFLGPAHIFRYSSSTYRAKHIERLARLLRASSSGVTGQKRIAPIAECVAGEGSASSPAVRSGLVLDS